MMSTLDGFPVPVDVAGPKKGTVVVILAAAQRVLAAYDGVCERLHTGALRTVVIGHDPRLTPKSVVGILDGIGIGWAVVVGDGAGGDLAWELAATRLGRFIGLVAVDSGHPRVANLAGVIRDADCPPVEINTTILVSTSNARAVAQASQRFVYADYRVVDLVSRRNVHESTAQLAAEIVMRTATW